MKTLTSTEIRSTLTSQGYIELSILTVDKPTPAEDEVLIRVEAAPINPSDLGLLLTFGADLDNINVSGSGDKTVTKIKVNDRLIKVMEQRLDQSLQVGNEGGGIVEDAGDSAKDLIGKTVGVAGGSMYAKYRCIPAKNCLVMDDTTNSVEAASSFVNPFSTKSLNIRKIIETTPLFRRITFLFTVCTFIEKYPCVVSNSVSAKKRYASPSFALSIRNNLPFSIFSNRFVNSNITFPFSSVNPHIGNPTIMYELFVFFMFG